MINSPIIEKLRSMRLNTFAKEFELQLLNSEDFALLGFEERLGLLVDAEWNQKQVNKLNNCVKNAHFPVASACIEEIEYFPDRKLDKAQILRFATCNFIDEKSHIIINGTTGTGKTYLACALGKSACRKFKNVKYTRMPELLDEFSISRIDGNIKKTVEFYCKADLLIIDDWLIRELNQQQAFDLLEIVEGRASQKLGRESMIICSQYDLDEWYERINPDPNNESPVTEAIIDRIMHKSHSVLIEGNISMRERHGFKYQARQLENI